MVEQIPPLRGGTVMRFIFLALLTSAAGAHADQRTFDQVLPHVRHAQSANECAFEQSALMTEATRKSILAAIDQSTFLLRVIAAEPRLDEKERSQLFEQLLRGDPDDHERGSVARTFWATITHHGADDVHQFNGQPTGFEIFKQTFYEAVVDVRSVVTYRRDALGQKHWSAAERARRERTAREVVVRFADIINDFDQFETRSDLQLQNALGLVRDVTRTAMDLRKQRVVAEKIAGAYYGLMLGLNAFVGPMVAPLVQVNYIGWVTHFAFASNVFTGGINLAVFAALGVANWIGRTGRTLVLLRELERMTFGAEGSPLEARRRRASRRAVIEGTGPLAAHRAGLMKRGYRFKLPPPVPCAQLLSPGEVFTRAPSLD